MRILGLGKTRISGKSHTENQKIVVILFVVIFHLCVRLKLYLQLFVYSLTTRCFMIYRTNQSFEFGCCQRQCFDDKFSISRIFTLENSISRILGEPFEMSHK